MLKVTYNPTDRPKSKEVWSVQYPGILYIPHFVARNYAILTKSNY